MSYLNLGSLGAASGSEWYSIALSKIKVAMAEEALDSNEAALYRELARRMAESINRQSARGAREVMSVGSDCVSRAIPKSRKWFLELAENPEKRREAKWSEEDLSRALSSIDAIEAHFVSGFKLASGKKVKPDPVPDCPPGYVEVGSGCVYMGEHSERRDVAVDRSKKRAFTSQPRVGTPSPGGGALSLRDQQILFMQAMKKNEGMSTGTKVGIGLAVVAGFGFLAWAFTR